MKKFFTKVVVTVAAVACIAGSAMTSIAAPRIGWVDVKNSWYYYDENSNPVTNQWIEYNDEFYWVDNTGKMLVQTWVKDGDSWYWVNAQGTRLSDCWVPITNEWYYVSEDGRMLANTWLTQGRETYYLTADGSAAKGWVEIDGTWHYFNRTNCDMERGTTIDGYYIDADGNYVG